MISNYKLLNPKLCSIKQSLWLENILTSLDTIVFGLDLSLKLGSGLKCLVVAMDWAGVNILRKDRNSIFEAQKVYWECIQL